MRPLCTTPQAASDVPICAYFTGKGIDWSAPAFTRSFAGIDVDAWARELFAAIDQVLAPTLAIPAAVLGVKDATDHLAPIREAKTRLVTSLATGLLPVFATSAIDAATQQAATAAFAASLQDQLSHAYAADVLPPPLLPLLRAFATAPEMVAQTATQRATQAAGQASPPAGAQRGALSAWDFAFTYARNLHAAQDLIQGKVRFNRCETRRAAKAGPPNERTRDARPTAAGDVASGAATGGGAAGRAPEGAADDATPRATNALLHDLANFVTVHPTIAQDLTRWLAPLDGATTDDTALTNARVALQSFTTLVSHVVEHWSPFPGPAAESGAMRGGADMYAFSIREREIAIDGTPALLVTIAGSTPPGTGVPRIEIDGYTATPHQMREGHGQGDAGAYTYVYARAATTQSAGANLGASPSPASQPGPSAPARSSPSALALLDPTTARAIANRTLVLPGLDAIARQDACASLQVVRNASLLADPTIPTAEPFLYRSEWARFTNAVQPLIDIDNVIDVASMASAAEPPAPVSRPLAQHLSALYATIFATDPFPSQLAQLDISYASAIREGLPAVEVPIARMRPTALQLPIDYHVPAEGCAPGGDGPQVCRIANTIQDWFEAQRPAGAGAVLWFDLLVFTSLNDTPTPLLRLRRASLPLAHVDPPLPAR